MSYTPDDLDNLRHRSYVDNKVGLAKLGGAKATFDFAALGGAIAAHGLAISIPAGGIVKRVFYVVRTTFVSATDAATIALSIEAADDLVAAAAISVGTAFDAAAPVATIADNAEANFIVATVERELTLTVAVEVLTAGKMDVYVEYEV